MKKSFILALLFTASHVSIAQTEAPLNDFPPTGILWDAIKTQNEINSATADQTAKIAANSNEIVVVKANVASLSNGLVTVEGRTNTWNDVVNKVSTNDATYLATVASASTALQSEADTNAIAQLEAHNVDSISHSALLKGKVGTNHTGAVSITGLLSVFDAGYPNEDGGKIRMAGGMYYGDWGIGLLPINNDMQDPANGHLYLYNRLVQRTIYDSGNFLAGTHYVAPSAITGMVTNNSTATLNLASGSTVATATAGSEPVTLDQALSLLASTTDLYLSPTVFTGAQVATTNRSLASMFSPTAWSVVYSGTVTAGQYLFSFTAPSNLVTAVQAGTQEADIYMTYAGGGGSTLTCKLEGYIFNPATTSSVDYAETSASFAVAKSATLPTTPQRLTAVIPYATNLVGNARYQIRVKAITASSVTSVTMWGGSNTISFVKLPVSKDVAVGTRGALAIESADGVAGTYDSTLRKLTMPNSLVPTNDVRYLAAITNGQRGPVTIGGLSLGRTGDGYPAVLDTSLGYMFFSVNGITQMGINNVAGFEFMKKVQLDDTLTVLGAVSLSSNLSSTGSVTASNMFTAANGVTNAVSTRDPYQTFTGTITPANGTATVVYAHGNMPSLTLTAPTVLTLDPASYGTSGVSRVSLSLYCGTNAVTLDTSAVTYVTAPTFKTNEINTILFRREANNAWYGVQLNGPSTEQMEASFQSWLASYTTSASELAKISQIGATPISALSSGATVTVTPVPQKKIYDVDASIPITLFTNNIASLNCNGTTNYEWTTRINYTSTNALSTAWEDRIEWINGTPDLTVTGRYEFAFSTSDGVKIQGRQVYPTVYTYEQLFCQALAGGNGSTITAGKRMLENGNSTTNATTFISTENAQFYNGICSLVMAGNNTNGLKYTFSWTAYGAGADQLGIYVETNTTVGTYSPIKFYIPKYTGADLTLGTTYIALSINTFRTHTVGTVDINRIRWKRINELEQSAYNAGWRP